VAPGIDPANVHDAWAVLPLWAQPAAQVMVAIVTTTDHPTRRMRSF
jgi:hypothetical protein